MKVTAVKQIGKTKPGGVVKVSKMEARALIALGFAVETPQPKPAPPPPVAKRTYERRDMTAKPSAPAAQPVAAMVTKRDGQA